MLERILAGDPTVCPPGSTVVIRVTENLTAEAVEVVAAHLRDAASRGFARFLVLSPGADILGVYPDDLEDAIAQGWCW